jgi:2-hydroxy-6-oxonona-2,4-dienedioate hydrolase
MSFRLFAEPALAYEECGSLYSLRIRHPMAALQDIVASLDGQATAYRTPCGDGDLVWRRWGRPDAPPVVLAHGGSGSWTHWLKTIPALIPHYDVWAVDLPGLGDSAMPNRPHTPETAGKVLADGLRQLIPAERRPQLVTFSFGGHVGMFAAIELAHHLASFTVSGCSALGLHPDLEDFPKERSTMTAEQRRHVHYRVLEILMIADPARIDGLAIDIQAANVAKARFKSREFAVTTEIRDRLGDVPVPVRAIWGARDVLANPSVDAVFETLRLYHPELDTRVVPDAGHWSMYEQPDAFNAALLEVLGGGVTKVFGDV